MTVLASSICKHLLPLFSPCSCAYYFLVLLSASVSPALSLCREKTYLITLMGLSFATPYPNMKPQMLPLRSSQPQWCYQVPWYFLPHKLFFPKGLHQSLVLPHIISHETACVAQLDFMALFLTPHSCSVQQVSQDLCR